MQGEVHSESAGRRLKLRLVLLIHLQHNSLLLYRLKVGGLDF